MVLDIVGEIIDSQIMHSKLFIFHAVYNVKQMEDLEPMKDYHLYFFSLWHFSQELILLRSVTG